MKLWLGLGKTYKITLLDGTVIAGIAVFYRTPNTDDNLPIVLKVEGKEIQVNSNAVLRIEESEYDQSTKAKDTKTI